MVPLKSRVLKRLKKMAYTPCHSPKRSTSFSPTLTRKPQLNRKGVVIRKIPTPTSPASKKMCVEDMDKHISNQQKKQRKLRIVEDSNDEDIVPKSPFGDNTMGTLHLRGFLQSNRLSRRLEILVAI